MGIVSRQSIKATIATYLAVIIGYLNLGYFFPKFFSTEQIGLISFLLGTSTLLVSVFQMGIPTTIVRYLPVVKKNNTERAFYLFSIITPLVFFIVVFGILALFSSQILNTFYPNNKLVEEYIFYIPLFALLIGFTGIWAAHSNSLLRIVVPTIIEKFISRLLILVMIFLVISQIIDFDLFIASYVVVYFICFLLTYFYFLRIKEKRNSNQEKLKPLFRKEILQFGAISFLTMIGARIVENIDVIMITSILDLSNAGIYKIAFYIGGVIMIPLGSIGQISSPLFAQFWKISPIKKFTSYTKRRP